MRLKFGRPDLDRYADHFDVPPADADGLSVTFLGVASLLFDDGGSALMTDGFFSRPSLPTVLLRRLSPDHARIDACLERAGVDDVEAVIPVHTHYDHALDSAVVAERTGAVLLGGTSAANVGRGHGLPEEQVVAVESGSTTTCGNYEVTMIASEHCPPDRYPGTIDEPLAPPARVTTYRCGEAWAIVLRHRPTEQRALVLGSAGYVEGALDGQQADVVYLGVGQLGLHSEEYIRTYWEETVGTVGARRVVLIHWDDFFRPLDQPLRALPYFGDDLDHSWRVLSKLAQRDGIDLHFPTLWQRENPWAGL
ncbi:MAG: MBL fold metallo-hydrolase [Nitriliruptorales bacterium]|nr:MBL fold metallo-hydrolase [Nitriliruptorales bacterium]